MPNTGKESSQASEVLLPWLQVPVAASMSPKHTVFKKVSRDQSVGGVLVSEQLASCC